MDPKRHVPGFLFILLFIFSQLLSPAGLKPGSVEEKVVCNQNPDQSYALYLPSSYDASGKWPVIFAFEPGGRGLIPVNLYKNSAEEFGYIVVCPYNSKNGPWKYVIRAMQSVWADIQKKFSVDKKRVVTTGFSGGSRAASLFSKITGVEPAGIIACGAGLQEKLTPSDLGGSFYYGIIGLEDFNYKEFQRLVPLLDRAGVRYCIDYVPGIHKWPGQDAIHRALTVMEADAVLRESKNIDTDRIQQYYRSLTGYADKLIHGDFHNYGVRYLDRIARHFRMLIPLDEEIKKTARLKGENKYIRFEQEDDERLRKEYAFISVFARAFNQIEKDNSGRVGLRAALNELRVPFLTGLVRKKKRPFDGYMATRLLFEIAIKADRSSSIHQKKGNEKKAVLFAEIAAETEINQDWYNFRLASVYALYGKKKKCIRLIRSLKKRGRILIRSIEQDPNFNEMLKDPDFMKIFVTGKK